MLHSIPWVWVLLAIAFALFILPKVRAKVGI